MHRRAHLGHAAAGLALALTASACVAPLTHPLRASNGPIAQFALAAAITSGDARSCYMRCIPAGNAVSVGAPQVTLGYAHVFERHIGLMGGVSTMVYPAGPATTFNAIAGTFVFATLQNAHGSVGIGPELSISGWAIALGAEWIIYGTHSWRPALGAYARWSAPFSGYDDGSGQITPHRTLELGARFHAGPLFVQYSYFAAVDGAIFQLASIEGSYTSSAVHVIAFGTSFDGDLIARIRDWREDRHWSHPPVQRAVP